MSAPTEQEIREAIAVRWADKAGIHDIYDGDEVLSTLITLHMADPLVHSAADTLEIDGGGVWEPLRQPHDEAIWTDLRPSQAARLVELAREACERAEKRGQAIILEELTAAGIQFASEYPDAPRPEREKVPA